MSRTKDDGLQYFPLDTGFFSDERIRRLTGRFGADGPLFYIYVLCRIYKEGYAIKSDDDFVEDAALDVKCSTEKIGLMMEYLLSRSLLTEIRVDTSLGTVTYITSHGIQAQYQKSSRGKKRSIDVDEALWLLNESETEEFIQVRPSENNSRKKADKSGNYPINPGNKPQSKVNKNKEKESKVLAPPDAAQENSAKLEIPFHGELKEAVRDWLTFKHEKRQDYKAKGLQELYKRIASHAAQYGEAKTAEVIRDSMACNYQGITFDRLQREHQKNGREPTIITYKGGGFFDDD